jgi:hypothetical protein
MRRQVMRKPTTSPLDEHIGRKFFRILITNLRCYLFGRLSSIDHPPRFSLSRLISHASYSGTALFPTSPASLRLARASSA